jgi:predicted ATPase
MDWRRRRPNATVDRASNCLLKQSAAIDHPKPGRQDPSRLVEVAPSAADVARIVPTLRERLNIAPRPPGDPEEDRWRLLQAATDLLHRVAAKQPLLVVLEDLHDADRGTLDLLLYLARNLHSARILIVGTYRDVEVDRAHPLSAALAELHRASNVARIQLHGLSTDEVQRLLAETSQQTVPQPFAELVQRQTEGNPLFIRETLRFVIDTGLVERRDGALRRVGDQTLAGRIPEGLRDAVGKRLSRLSDTTNRVLSVASVIGREFQLDVLSRVLAGREEELEAAIEEAFAAGIIEERSVVGPTITYRFSHAFFRQTLYDEIVAPRRIRLHQQVARAVENVYSRRLEEHAEELGPTLLVLVRHRGSCEGGALQRGRSQPRECAVRLQRGSGATGSCPPGAGSRGPGRPGETLRLAAQLG